MIKQRSDWLGKSIFHNNNRVLYGIAIVWGLPKPCNSEGNPTNVNFHCFSVWAGPKRYSNIEIHVVTSKKGRRSDSQNFRTNNSWMIFLHGYFMSKTRIVDSKESWIIDSTFIFRRVKKELVFLVFFSVFLFWYTEIRALFRRLSKFLGMITVESPPSSGDQFFCPKIPREHTWIDTGHLEWKNWPGWFGKRSFSYYPFSHYMNRALFWVSGVTCQGNTPIQTLSPSSLSQNRESLWPAQRIAGISPNLSASQ